VDLPATARRGNVALLTARNGTVSDGWPAEVSFSETEITRGMRLRWLQIGGHPVVHFPLQGTALNGATSPIQQTFHPAMSGDGVTNR
jgi:hypothetical protein